MRAKPNAETVIQRTILDAIRYHGIFCVRVPVQGVVHQLAPGKVVMKKSEMAGFPDILVFGADGRSAWLEVKTAKGTLSEIQKYVHARLRDLGHNVAVVRSAEDAIEVLRLFEIIPPPQGHNYEIV